MLFCLSGLEFCNTHFTWIFDEIALAKVNFMTTTQNDDAKLSPRDQILKSDFDVGGSNLTSNVTF